MDFSVLGLLTLTAVAKCAAVNDTVQDDPEFLARAKELLARLNVEYAEWNNKQTLAAWAYASNLTDHNLAAQLNVSAQFADYKRQMWQEVKDFPWQGIKDFNTRRQFEKLATPGASALSKEVHFVNFNTLLNHKIIMNYLTTEISHLWSSFRSLFFRPTVILY